MLAPLCLGDSKLMQWLRQGKGRHKQFNAAECVLMHSACTSPVNHGGRMPAVHVLL